jgi:sugar phosphate isomerase/epimerase
MIRIGARAHDFGRHAPEELARRLASKGMTCAQLAVNKAIAGLDLKAGDMNPGLAWHIGRAFQKHGVQIAVLGCYINPANPDPVTRGQSLQWFKDHLRYARDFGCAIVGLETGTPTVDYSPHPDTQSEPAFQTMLSSIAELVECAEHHGAIVCIEAVTVHTVSTPKRMKRVLDTIRSSNLQVIFDPVNLINQDNYKDQDRIMQESFDLFGDRIAIIHAKDFKIENGVYKQVKTGEGILNHKLFMNWVTARKPGISILLEEASEETAEACAKYIRDAAGIG